MKKFIALFLALTMVLAVAACGQSATTPPSVAPAESSQPAQSAESTAEGGEVVVVMPKLTANSVFQEASLGAKQCAEDFNFTLIWDGPVEADVAEQVNMIEDYITQGVDAIAVAANDSAALSSVFKKATENGVEVIGWDGCANQSDVVYLECACRDNDMGVAIWKNLAEAMNGTGTYAILTGVLAAENLNTWIKAGMDWMEANYPDIKLVTDIIPTDESQQLAYQKTLELLQAYPDLDGIVAMSAPALPGAGQAIQEKGLQGQLVVVGNCLPADVGEYLEDQSITSGTLYSSWQNGYLAAYCAIAAVRGYAITNDTKLEVMSGNCIVEGNKIYVGQPITFTKENWSEYVYELN